MNLKNLFEKLKSYQKRLQLYIERDKIADRIYSKIGSLNLKYVDFENILEEYYNNDNKKDISKQLINSNLLKLKYLEQLDFKEYVIWGTGMGGIHAKEILELFLKEKKCIGFIDSFKSGNIGDLPVFKADTYDFSKKKAYIIVAATKAEQVICDRLDSYNLVELEDYMPQLLY